MERDFKGIWIPKEIWLNKDLNALEKIIFAEIDSFSTSEQGCCAGNEYLAEFCQCSESKVSRAIKKLIELKLIKVVSFDGRHRVLQSRLAENTRQSRQFAYADEAKSTAINIDINKDINISCSSGDEPSSNDKLTDGVNSNNEPFFKEDKNSNTSSKVDTKLESDTDKSLALRRKKEREKELKRIAESIWEEYPNKAGKTSAINSIVQFLDGKKKINGEKYKLSIEQLLNATMDYAEEVEGRDRQYICQGSTFYNGRILDYIKEEK